ncbi:MAG: 50S ribosomal protein L11 methyltransferase [Clostridiales bacterium]|jgi:ribosomal protein L11 methyltransferase|nr:50S ribosomal protein L11 methyltransferase [Clostridiales bacterium]
MKWTEITIRAAHEAADAVSEIFFSMGCQGVSVIDKRDVTDVLKNGLYWDYADSELLGNADETVKVAGFFPLEEYLRRAVELSGKLENLRANFPQCGSLEIAAKQIDDSDWANNWKKYYKPIVVGKIRIIPEWLKNERKDGLTALFLEPGMAFGTGEHETTKMCLELMQSVDLKDKILFDVGCGSGILGIAAAALGAYAFMTDIDPAAVFTAKKNAERNGVSDRTEIKRADLLSDFGEENPESNSAKNRESKGGNDRLRQTGKDGAEIEIDGKAEANSANFNIGNNAEKSAAPQRTEIGKADVITANLTADILIRFSRAAKRRLKKDGSLIISGIINERENEVAVHYAKNGFEITDKISDGDWRAMKLKLSAK